MGNFGLNYMCLLVQVPLSCKYLVNIANIFSLFSALLGKKAQNWHFFRIYLGWQFHIPDFRDGTDNFHRY